MLTMLSGSLTGDGVAAEEQGKTAGTTPPAVGPFADGAVALEHLLAGAPPEPDAVPQLLPQILALICGDALPVDPEDRAACMPGTPAEQFQEAFSAVFVGVHSVGRAGNPEDGEALRELLTMAASAGTDAGPEALLADLGDVASRMPAAEQFQEAFSAALVDAHGVAAAGDPESGEALCELLAMGAAAAHMVPGGAAAVEQYVSRRKRDPRARRWGARVRTLLREARLLVPRQHVGAYRRGRTRRTPRRRSHRHVCAPSRAGPQDDPVPDEAVPHLARAADRGGVS